MKADKRRVFVLVDRVWGGGRSLTAREHEELAALPGAVDGEPVLDTALRALGVLGDYERAGRPAYGQFASWWMRMEVLGKVSLKGGEA